MVEEVNVTLADPEKEAKEAGEKKVDDLVKDVTNDKFSGVDEVKKEFEDQKAKVTGLFDGLSDLTNSIGECSGLGEQFAEIAEQIDGLSDKFDALVDKFVDKITNVLGLPAVEANLERSMLCYKGHEKRFPKDRRCFRWIGWWI